MNPPPAARVTGAFGSARRATGLDDIVELLLPELRRRGLFRKEYRGTTLREHLDLARPENRFSRSSRALSAD